MALRKTKSNRRQLKSSRARKRRQRQQQANRLGFETLEDRQLLATFAVTNLNDAGGGSLRAAIGQANSNSGADEIVFSGIASSGIVSSGVIGLTSGEIEITDSLTINGPGQEKLTVDGNLQSRIFDITQFNGNVTIAGLTLTNGLTTGFAERGGAVRSRLSGNLTIDQSTIYQNSTTGGSSSGAGVYSYNTLTITDSTFSENRTTGAFANGGGVFAANSVTIKGSTFSGNGIAGSNSFGGGIAADGDVTLTQSTVSGNSANGSSTGGAGIAVLSFVGDLTLSQSTVTDNHAFSQSATGGGIGTDSGSVSITNSIVARNTAGGGSPDLRVGTGTLTVGYSLIGVADGLPFNPVTNKTGTAASPLNPSLGSLADNGGTTLTHLPSRFSPVLDSGNRYIAPNVAEFDQRGAPFQRVVNSPFISFGPRIDMGAVERQSVPASFFIVNTAVDEFDYSNTDVSLREAVYSANATTTNSTITFAETLSGQTITLGGTQLEITRPVTVDATALAENVIIDADLRSRIIDIHAFPGDVTLAGLTLTSGLTTGDFERGGAIRSALSGNLTIDRSTVYQNSTTGESSDGGGVFSLGPVTITDSTISENRTTGFAANGGGVFADTTVTITGSTLSGNGIAGAGRGGGLFSFGAITLVSSTVSGNSSNGNSLGGAGIASFGNRSLSSLTISQSTVTDNHAFPLSSTGGGIWNDGNGPITISNSIISNNTAAGGSPDLRSGTGTLNVDYSLISDTTGSGVVAGAGVGNLLGVNPNLAALADNGGPTQTHALLPSSPAIDAGSNALAVDADGQPLTADQRGFVRFFDGDSDGTLTVDIGAVELSSPQVVATVRDEGGVLRRPDLIEKFSATFNVGVNVETDDLRARNETLGGTDVELELLSGYSPVTRTVDWFFSSTGPVLDAGYYTFEISDGVTETGGGLPLNGDGDGTPGGDYLETVYVALPGDANLDGRVDVLGDAFALVSNLGTTSGAVWEDGDFNGDGFVNVLGDAFILISRLGRSVVPPSAAPTSVQSLGAASSLEVPEDVAVSRVATTYDIETVRFVTEQNDDHQRSGGVSPSKQLSLAGSQDLDAAFASDNLIEEGVF